MSVSGVVITNIHEVTNEAAILECVNLNCKHMFYVLRFYITSCPQCKSSRKKVADVSHRHPKIPFISIEVRNISYPRFFSAPMYVPSFVLCSIYAGQIKSYVGTESLNMLDEKLTELGF